nr:uncharacterized protein LOC111833400 [Paramormyrops kingsleyae]
MSALWKLSAPLSPTKDSSQALELVRCIGKAMHTTDSGITGVNMENSEFAKLTKKQTKSSIRSKPGNLRPKRSNESMSQLAVYPRLGTVNAEKWWSTEMSGWDLSERTKSCHRFKSPSRRPSPAFWASHASRVTTARTQHSQDSKASRLRNSMKHENYQSSGGSTEPLNQPMQSRKIPLKRRTLCLKTSITAGLHGPCILQCVGFAPGRGDAGLEKSCSSDMNSQHFGIFTRGRCRTRHGDSSLLKETKQSGSLPPGSHTEIFLLNSENAT